MSDISNLNIQNITGFPVDLVVVGLGVLVIILIILMLGILHTGIAYCYYFDGMARLPLTTYAVLGYFEPVVSVLCSVFLLHEKMTLGGLCGTVMIIMAALMSELLTNAQGPFAGEEAV